MKYGIYVTSCWLRVPLSDTLTIMNWMGFEDLPEMEFENIVEATNALKERHTNELYVKNVRNGTEVLLCYIINEDYDVVAALDYDGKVITNEHKE